MSFSADEFRVETENDELRQALANTQRQLKRAKAKTDDLVDATYRGAKEAMLALGPAPAVAAPKADRRQKKPETALWHLTDWQGAKVTTTYNSRIMRERVLRYCDRAQRVTEIQRADHPVRDCTIMFGGDLIEGLFNYPAQPHEIDATLFRQYTQTARLVVDVVRRALAIYSRVEVVGEWGNHGRIGSKRAAVPASDNFDRMVQWLARELLADEKRLSWEDRSEHIEHVEGDDEDEQFFAADIQHIEIGNYRALLIHGDEVGRNGYASPMTIVNHVAKWKSGSHRWAFQDCYLGHYHTHNEWSLPDGLGAVYQTGSPESDNRYAGTHMASAAMPSQRLHFIDPDEGLVTAQYKVWLAERLR